MSARILVADDDRKTAAVVSAYMERAGHTVVTVHDGRAALVECRRRMPDLAVLDVMMPHLDGRDVCHVLRAETDMPIIFLTARATEDDMVHGLGLGADDYVTKPFSPRALVARVDAVLRRTRPADVPTVLRVGPLEVDEERHEVRLEGRSVDCTPAEFRILRELMAAPGRVFTRARLLETAFGFDHDALERTVDAHVMNLRRKIEPDPARPATSSPSTASATRWSPTTTRLAPEVATTFDVSPFRIEVADDVLVDLAERLRRTRWPDDPGGGWSHGVPLPWLRELCDYWVEEFDWRAVERRLNEYPQFLAQVDGAPVHFLHVRGQGPAPTPVVLTVGWPSTFAEVLPVVDLLTDPGAHGGDPADAVDLVVPTFPGFAFSTPYAVAGPRPLHDWWAALMAGLGYDRFAASGSDIGARVTTRLGRFHADRVIGIHLAGVDLDLPVPLPDPLSDDERDYLARAESWDVEEGGYAAIQGTRPQTLGYALNDSPSGMAAWIVEKFHAWSDHDGDVHDRFSRDDLLTAATIYWVTGSINSANRHYYEARHDPAPPSAAPGTRVEVPTAISMFPGESDLVVPRSLAERAYHVVQWTEPARGGHFAAHEEPTAYVADLVTFLRSVR